MSPSIRRAESQASSEAEQKAAIKKALEDARGKISAAANAAQLARVYFHRLLIKYDLVAFARELRIRAGGRARGRPRKR